MTADEEPPAQWQPEYVLLSNRTKLGAPVEKVTRGLLAALRSLRRSPPPAPPEVKDRLDEARVEALTPQSETADLVTALRATLDPWLSVEAPDRWTRVALHGPGHRERSVMAMTAEALGWRSLAPPTAREIIESPAKCLEAAQRHAEDQPVVIDALEGWYLRHHQGLELLRELIDWLLSRESRALIGCGAWAWSYLTHALQIDTVLPAPITLQSVDAATLLTVLRAHPPLSGVSLRVGEEDLLDPSREAPHAWLQRLVSTAQGHPGVILSLWREAVSQSTEVDGGALKLPSISNMKMPRVPEKMGIAGIFTLHNLLLHGALRPAVLKSTLLPLFPQLNRTLQRLEESGVIERRNGSYEVRLAGYPAARNFLFDSGYLVDAFE